MNSALLQKFSKSKNKNNCRHIAKYVLPMICVPFWQAYRCALTKICVYFERVIYICKALKAATLLDLYIADLEGT
jgi:hypothetical protein